LPKKIAGTVIVVDDDLSIRRALQRLLEAWDFNVLLFSSAEELLASVLPIERVCLLLDVYLPGLNGIELCRILEASGRELPTILMSGRDDQQTRQIMRQTTPIARLFKPFDETTLLRALRKGLGNHPKLLS
jgi:FixJ family two-component response regulator